MKIIHNIITKFLGRKTKKKELNFESFNSEICITCRGKGTVLGIGERSARFGSSFWDAEMLCRLNDRVPFN